MEFVQREPAPPPGQGLGAQAVPVDGNNNAMVPRDPFIPRAPDEQIPSDEIELFDGVKDPLPQKPPTSDKAQREREPMPTPAEVLAEARWLEARGVDAVIAQGLEAGGHRGMFLSEDLNTQIGTFALLPQIVRAVNVPVIAAGGIADARGVAAALALGAIGVQVGTAYMLCPEARTSAVHRSALKSKEAELTALTNLFSGRPARGIVNRIMRELGPISAAAPAFPLATAAIAPLRKAAEERGIDGFSPLWAGQNVSGCREISAAAITRLLAGLPTA